VRPGLDFDAFRRALRDVSVTISAARATDHREVPSGERFARALAACGAADAGAAEALSLAHMAHIAGRTILPADHADVLRDVGRRHRLGLVSNFDHAPTAHAVLARHGVATCFAVTLISDSFGRRKPHPAIFAAALAQLDVPASEALYVGDTHADDVVGALACGMDVAWIVRPDEADREPRATHRIASLAALRDLLAAGD
jgi:HAD superfamily hydrolase (TIGR01549 family)